MRLKKYAPIMGLLLMQGLVMAARATRQVQQDSIPVQIAKSGWCMISECSPFTLLFVIVPAFCVWFYRTFIRLGI